jgi:hypothetical protein
MVFIANGRKGARDAEKHDFLPLNISSVLRTAGPSGAMTTNDAFGNGSPISIVISAPQSGLQAPLRNWRDGKKVPATL